MSSRQPSPKRIATCSVGLLALMALVLSCRLHFAQAQGTRTVTVHVFHICDRQAAANPDVLCELAGVNRYGSRRGDPRFEIFTPWPCDPNDPAIFPGYDESMNFGCGPGIQPYPADWDNPRTMDIEEYLPDVREVPDDWPAESLQAQAVAARSFVWANTEGGTTTINNSIAFQFYVPNSHILRPNWTANVAATAGIYLEHSTTTLVDAKFSRDHTEDWTVFARESVQ